jgi:hypothetical protein
MGFKVYDADQVSVNIAGIPVTGGYADGEFLRIEFEGDAFTDVAGTDGEVTRSKTNDRRATATLSLMQTADANNLLAGLAELDRNSPNGAGVGAFLVRDRQGTAIYEASECWIQKTPDATFDREATPREWVVRIASLIDFTGGT